MAVGWDDCGGQPGDKILVKDNIADITLQQVLTRPDDFDVIATTNLNGDYLSDALAAQVGGIGIAPGANINYVTGHGIFEATHGTAPKYAGQDKVNPGSVLLSGVMMFEHLGWQEAADDIVEALQATISRQDRDLRLRPPDGRGHRSQDVRVRQRHRRSPLALGIPGPSSRAGTAAPSPSPGPPHPGGRAAQTPREGATWSHEDPLCRVQSGSTSRTSRRSATRFAGSKPWDFDTVWLSDIPLGATLDPVVGLSFAAAATSSLKLGANVVPIGRNPLTLAKSLAQIDQMSGGRLLLSFVVGLDQPGERQALGVGAGANRGRLIEEIMPLLRAWWAGESVTYESERYHFEQRVLTTDVPDQQPLEVWFGGSGPRPWTAPAGWPTAGWDRPCPPPRAGRPGERIEKAAAEVGRTDRPGALRPQRPLRRRRSRTSRSIELLRSRRPDANLGRPAPSGARAASRAPDRLHRRRPVQVRGAPGRA